MSISHKPSSDLLFFQRALICYDPYPRARKVTASCDFYASRFRDSHHCGQLTLVRALILIALVIPHQKYFDDVGALTALFSLMNSVVFFFRYANSLFIYGAFLYNHSLF